MSRFIFVFSTFLAVFFACSSDRIAGSTGGSETTNGVTACILNVDGTPAAGSVVRLRRADYFSELSALAKTDIDSTDFIIDSLGQFMIFDLEPGEYCIEVNNTSTLSGRSGAVLFSVTIDSCDTVELGTNSLYPYATLAGSVDLTGLDGKQLFAQLRGLERLVLVDNTGSFVFDDLPKGLLDLRIIDGGTTDVAKEILNVKTFPDDTIEIKVSGSTLYSGYIYLNTDAVNILTSTLTDFPLLVRLDSSSFDFSLADPEGDDVHFVKMDNTSLPHEIEQWDPVSQNAAVWVRIDTIHGSRSDQFIIMKWGETDVVSQSNGAAVFDTSAGFAGVWHLNENPSSGTGAIKDRTANGYHGTPSSSMRIENMVSGICGTGLMFNGISDSIEAGLLNLDGNYSLSCWVNASQSPSVNWRFIIKEASYTLWYYTEWEGVRAEHFDDSYVWRGIYQDTRDSVPYPMILDTWYYLVSTFDGDKICLYVNGELVDSTLAIGENPHVNENLLLIGGRENEFFKGIMDEVRIETKARPAEWIRLCYGNQQAGDIIIKFKMR